MLGLGSDFRVKVRVVIVSSGSQQEMCSTMWVIIYNTVAKGYLKITA